MTEKVPAVSRKQCGSVAGYRQHIKRGEKTCSECRAAQAAKQRERRAGKVPKRGESREKKRHRQEMEGAEIVDRIGATSKGDYPVFLQAPGRQLWDAIRSEYDLGPAAITVLTEACRMKDRLERFEAALSKNSTLWFELGESEERLNGQVEVNVVVNNMVGEARQMQAAVATALNKIGVLKPAEEKGGDVDVMDEIARKRAARLEAAGREA